MAILVTSCSLKLLPIGLLWSYYHSLASAETVSYNPKSAQWMIFKSHEGKKKKKGLNLSNLHWFSRFLSPSHADALFPASTACTSPLDHPLLSLPETSIAPKHD